MAASHLKGRYSRFQEIYWLIPFLSVILLANPSPPMAQVPKNEPEANKLLQFRRPIKCIIQKLLFFENFGRIFWLLGLRFQGIVYNIK
jgi:hypothetical protein